MKKTYIAPEMEEVKLALAQMLCESNTNTEIAPGTGGSEEL